MGTGSFFKKQKAASPRENSRRKSCLSPFHIPAFAVSVWFFSSLLSEVNAVDDVKIASTGSTVVPAIRNRRTKWIFS
jgi:hypothetical protein